MVIAVLLIGILTGFLIHKLIEVFSEDQKTLSLRTEVDDPRKDPSGRFEVACQRALELNGKRPAAAWREVIGAA